MSDGRARLQPCRKNPLTLSFRPQQITARAVICGVEEPCVFLDRPNHKPMWGRAPSPVQAERKLGKVGRSSVAYLETAATIGTAESRALSNPVMYEPVVPSLRKARRMGHPRMWHFGRGQRRRTRVYDPHKHV